MRMNLAQFASLVCMIESHNTVRNECTVNFSHLSICVPIDDFR